MGYRFRLHRRDLPGTPDVVLPKRRVAIFVHGCFWHGHHCKRGRPPKSNTGFWVAKVMRNRARDESSVAALAAMGWTPVVIWQCDTGNRDHLASLLSRALEEF